MKPTYTVVENVGLPPMLSTESKREAHRFQKKCWDKGQFVFVIEGEPERKKQCYVPIMLPQRTKAFVIYWATKTIENHPEVLLAKDRPTALKALREKYPEHTYLKVNTIKDITEWYLAGHTEGKHYQDKWKGYGQTYMPPYLSETDLPNPSETPDGEELIKYDTDIYGACFQFKIPKSRMRDFPGKLIS